MAYSILHRASGLALAAGVVCLVAWLWALAAGPSAFAVARAAVSGPVGLIALMGWTWALLYHLLNGVRHLVWDTGRWLDLPAAARSGHAAGVGSLALAAAVWLIALA